MEAVFERALWRDSWPQGLISPVISRSGRTTDEPRSVSLADARETGEGYPSNESLPVAHCKGVNGFYARPRPQAGEGEGQPDFESLATRSAKGGGFYDRARTPCTCVAGGGCRRFLRSLFFHASDEEDGGLVCDS
jgi:hypothetical protein